MPSLKHELLSQSACAWAMRYGFVSVALNTQMAGGPGDHDAVAVGTIRGKMRVAVFESKTSRSDFKADMKKWHRTVGKVPSKWARDWAQENTVSEFWYVTEKGLVDKSELPPGWGLLEVDENGRASITKRADVFPVEKEAYDNQMRLTAKACAQKYLTGGGLDCRWRRGNIELDANRWNEACGVNPCDSCVLKVVCKQTPDLPYCKSDWRTLREHRQYVQESEKNF